MVERGEIKDAHDHHAPCCTRRGAADVVGPRLIRAFVRALLAIFYRRVDVAGLEHVPATGRCSWPPITRTAWSIPCC